jgi:hypothetical protein
LESKNEVYESRFLPKRDKMDLKWYVIRDMVW